MPYPGQALENPVTGQTIYFMTTARQSAGTELVLESSYRAWGPEPLPHFHPQQEELFEVLQGELMVRLDGQLRTLQRGERLRIGPGQVHAMWNGSPTRAVVRWSTRPALRTEEFLETLFSLAQSGLVTAEGTPGWLQTSLLLHEYAAEFRLAKPPRWLQQTIFAFLRPLARLIGLKAVYGPRMQPAPLAATRRR
ncbi:cupin domain-containing protein [Hymenobacter sp. CRA2]|uniref:cupin domain-containing protein n=1 Tax=Hymenobacter sp. CRA2 TaxID=1955620 RepID=UPI0009C8A2C1|nr:cupin domain-containing protein [Hymenobacter sp. CRA2]OON67109.1 hypothetical protein B0919_19980 [Hymenobacter sp. CRA2]